MQPIATTAVEKDAFDRAYQSKAAAAKLSWISSIPLNGLASCPFCGGDGARTIEHYLPQASYPEFSIYSLNLMPSCGDCNRKRNDSNAYGADVKLLHPYFDRALLNNIDVFIKINLTSNIPDFEITYNDSDFEDNIQERIDHHIATSIDETAFYNKMISTLQALKVHARKHSNAQSFRDVIQGYIDVSVETNEPNSWTHALCKGLMKLSDNNIDLIFGEHFI
ncbi:MULTISPECIES: hypothetical protein [unclassified Pseudomonas]|uniref:hypothetical protein n=1 Tax=unclassified Pseudomonas TaxID=196821 RepID=UPI002010426F|nr:MULTISPECIES: hypothetical protein [unclassified Pseudomonas]